MRRVDTCLHDNVILTSITTTRQRQTWCREASRPTRQAVVAVIESTRVARRNGRAANIHIDRAERITTGNREVHIDFAIGVFLRGPASHVDAFGEIISSSADVQRAADAFADLLVVETVVPAPALAGFGTLV